MDSNAAASHVQSRIEVTRELIARAKHWLTTDCSGSTEELVHAWLKEQCLVEIREINLQSPTVEDDLSALAKSYGARLSFYQAIAELIGEGRIIPASLPRRWEPSSTYADRGNRGGLPFRNFGFSYPERIEPSPFRLDTPVDVDIFLAGVNCSGLHSGIHEAIEQSLLCFRRGLYLPSIAMLAAAAEATWSECAKAVAKNQSNIKLAAKVGDPQVGFGQIVAETAKILESGEAKPLLQAARQSRSQLSEAVVWTTVLRDRRNALHWGKAKSFIADHCDTGVLLMAAPMHLGTLEAIRLAC